MRLPLLAYPRAKMSSVCTRDDLQPAHGYHYPRCGRRSLVGPEVRLVLHLEIHEIEGRGGVLEHTPALQPLVRALHLLERDWGRIADDEAAFAQVLHLQGRDLRLLPLMIVDEVVEIGALVGIDATDGLA